MILKLLIWEQPLILNRDFKQGNERQDVATHK